MRVRVRAASCCSVFLWARWVIRCDMQILGYMSRRGNKYGAISTYRHTYLLEVVQHPGGVVLLRISAAIPHSARSSPTQLSVTEVFLACRHLSTLADRAASTAYQSHLYATFCQDAARHPLAFVRTSIGRAEARQAWPAGFRMGGAGRFHD